eukprot:CAMPEP_0198333444 /NCGR_PEP_ID=MMETSP1450-20131203/18957_1 /TAXON_ID=753684 ORGANISM="Madagascaria erythrocladiodes, Strain CCMP3234" /NCGR_SAMPLE_ID=MMETSP1450 /ASSEMBLY_ACC=CAM_ASM_001115 /LENGTH=258 /DNA_ID=CAMNT_0044037963 /DNA_START=40 /DNA_END=816 /DNA_ORIENTATION=-
MAFATPLRVFPSPNARQHVVCATAPGRVTTRRIRTVAKAVVEEVDSVAAEARLKERVTKELADDGIDLEQLLNPEKVLKLERKLLKKRAILSGEVEDPEEKDLEKVQKDVEKMERDLVVEKRLVMQKWLKDLFLYQGFLVGGIGGLLAYGTFPGWNGDIPLVAKALGFWTIWLFTIPSWRARKPTKVEKSALNVAFLATPLANLLIPIVSKDTFLIWSTNVLILLGCYLYYGAKGDGSSGSGPKIKGVLRFLDYGSWR